MQVLTQCPSCPHKFAIAESAKMATCPKCFHTFSSFSRNGTPEPSSRETVARADEAERDEPEESSLPGWISPWGLGAFVSATLGSWSASLLGLRSLTCAFACLGLVLAIGAIPATRRRRKSKDWVWMILGGGLSATLLWVTLFSPGLLNRYWAMDAAVPLPDPNNIVIVPRDEALTANSRPYSAEEGADALTDAIRQDDVVVRIESVSMGPVAERGGQEFMLIHMRIGSCGKERRVVTESLLAEKHKAVLKDNLGRSYALLEQRPRKLGAGPPHVFVKAPPEPTVIPPGRYYAFQLVFEPPPAGFSTLTLEIPASAWGRKGVHKLRIKGPFEAPLPELRKVEEKT
jgi:hypothetical protein